VPLQDIDEVGMVVLPYVATNVAVLKSPWAVDMVNVVVPVLLVAELNAKVGAWLSTRTVYTEESMTWAGDLESLALNSIVLRPAGIVAARLQTIELPGVTVTVCQVFELTLYATVLMQTYGDAQLVVDAGYPTDAAALPVKMTADVGLAIRDTPATVCGVGDVTEIVGEEDTEVTVAEELVETPPSTPEAVRVDTVPTVDGTVHEMVPKPLTPLTHPNVDVPLVSPQPAGMYALTTDRDPPVAARLI